MIEITTQFKGHSSATLDTYKDIDPLLMDIQKAIIERGDEAVLEYAVAFDKIDRQTFNTKVSEEHCHASYQKVPQDFIDATQKAKTTITAFHKEQLPQDWEKTLENGVRYGNTYKALDSVGLYVPGGRAPYPSTVLMTAIPAILAGVKNIVIATPPQPDGHIPPQILVAAHICGVKNIVKVGGAQAIFGLAYGTDSIPKVDKIVGPGNKYVDRAKQLVYGQVDIDKPAGPSDVVVYITDPNYAEYAAAEMLAQLEHDPDASAFTVSNSKETLMAIQKELETQLETLNRKAIIKESIKNAQLILKDTEEAAIQEVNTIAGEHVVLLVDNPDPVRTQIQHGASIFCGPYTPVTLGDYIAGPNHVLPTNGTARFASPLGVMDFMKFSSHLTYTKDALKKEQSAIQSLTNMEGFDAHYQAVKFRKA